MRKFLLASTLLAPLAAHAQTQTCTVPGPAAAAGDTIETFGQQPLSVGTTPNQATSYPQFTNGADLVPFDFFGTSWTDIGETSGNGAVTFNGTGETYGNGLATASQTPAGQTLNGIAFGGGGYYQVTMSGNGPMSFWMNDATTMDTGSSPQDSWIEADIAEFDTTGAYAFTLHNWYSPVGSGNAINANEDGASPPGANYTQPNNYGMLWVPATATTQGSVSFYFNGTQVGNTITWNQYVPGQSAPDNPFAVMDEEHMVPILGAGPGTTATFSDLQVWQSSAADDIGTGAATAAAAQPCSGGTTTMSATPIAAVSASATPAVVGQPLVPQTSLSAVTASAAPAASGQPMTPQNSLSSITGSSGATSSSSGSAASDPASATIIPGQGSLMDSNGNVWTITASGSIEENNTYTPGGGGTAALSIVNGTVYGQDGNTTNSGGWFTLSGNDQSWAVSSPPPVTAPASAAATSKAAPTPAAASSAAAAPAPSAAVAAPPTPTSSAAAPIPAPQTLAVGQDASYSCNTTVPNSPPANGGFATINGQFYAPNGTPWIAHGVNVPDFDMQTAQNSLLSLLPGTNFIRLNIYTYAAPSTYQSFINWATSQGIVVEIDDHASFPSNAFSGSQLTAETNFFTAMASAYINNPYVWYETQNEPQGGDITAENVAVYNAVRTAGNNNPVGFQPLGGGNPGFLSSMDASAYTSMSNVYMTVHFYAWIDGYSTDPATVSAALGNEISPAQSLQSGDGPMPVIIDEYGDNVNNTAAGGTQAVAAVLASGYGNAAWSFDNPGGGTEDQLTNNEQSLTAFGQQLAAAEPSTGPGCNISPVATLVPSTATVTAPSSGTGTPLAPQNSLTVIPAPAGMN
jgi:hypothetical protein